ncbi:MAG: M15 family metallopeptidase [Candidatus Sumerlaeota bacterium]|nr:M15 family metallopeptidase [Candidatus Sumerlaeota bacterium]
MARSFPRCKVFQSGFAILLACSAAVGAWANGSAAVRRLEPPQAWLFFGDEFAARSAPSLKAPESSLRVKRGMNILMTQAADDLEGHPWLGWECDGGTFWIPGAYLTRVAKANQKPGNLPIGEEVVNYDEALPLKYAPDDLEELPLEFRYSASIPYPLRTEAREHAIAFLRAAQDEGVSLKVVSAFRTMETQRRLYLEKVKETGLGESLVAKPGHSEHQLGTTIDVAGPDKASLLAPEFGDTREGQWVKQNCRRFGFVISYTAKNRPLTHYSSEPWHLRYVGVDKAKDWKP